MCLNVNNYNNLKMLKKEEEEKLLESKSSQNPHDEQKGTGKTGTS